MNQIAFQLSSNDGVVTVVMSDALSVPAPLMTTLVQRYGDPSVELGGTFALTHQGVAHSVVLPLRQVRIPASLPVRQDFAHATYADGLADALAVAWVAEITHRLNQTFATLQSDAARSPLPDGMITAPLLAGPTTSTAEEGVPLDVWLNS